ncbi:UDP-forming cellulose synthase catalytic subunit [Marinimicrococcus flavescens]|uniref:Cellulose synthase catalytic subunit [UDP-forming] n=1 Tax=Marinimicrococcus flavescens TaxID=3031815 RepID=A0AAP3UZA4_9PROT|nr:UDP-forming cellulose synthase catalytic subunit [Marinimicrococcus flavescens]
MVVAWLLALGAVLWLASIDVGIGPQILLAGGGVLSVLVLRLLPRAHALRLLLICLALFVSARYLLWRVTETVPTGHWYEAVPAVILLLAELYGFWLLTSGVFMTIRPLERVVARLPAERRSWPTVDILVPTYNEPWPLVEATLVAARQMRWPEGRMRVWCCDDGGTEAFRNHADPARAAAARERHEEFKRGCAAIGVTYITRPENKGAKAGNLNRAMQSCSGELVAVFDADHAPSADFLEKTVGQFFKDDRLALVQTPHFFIGPDPLEKNLGMFGHMPSEADMFYSMTLKGLDFWNAAFFCGSAAVMRRKALDEIGGIKQQTVTEDAHTAMELHSRGWNSAYVNVPMVAGLQPATMTSLVKQRVRWAQGMVQIFLLDNPFLKRGLSTAQRLCYAALSGFWFFPFARLVFLVAPLAQLLFGLQLFDAGTDEFLAYAIPHLAVSILLNDHLYGKLRWTFMSEVYETALAPYVAPAILNTILHPRSPSFAVTSKDETLDREFLSPMARPFLVLAALVVLGVANGLWTWLTDPVQQQTLVVVLGWGIFNLWLVLAVLAAMWETRQVREFPRVQRDIEATLVAADTSIACRLTDVSITGAQLAAGTGAVPDEPGEARLVIPGAGADAPPLDVAITNRRSVGAEDLLGLRFLRTDAGQIEAIGRLVYGRSDHWQAIVERRTRSHGLVRGVSLFFSMAFRGARLLLQRS